MANPYLNALANLGIIAAAVGTAMIVAAITIYWPDCRLCRTRRATRLRVTDNGRQHAVCGRCAKDLDFIARARKRAWATREILTERQRRK